MNTDFKVSGEIFSSNEHGLSFKVKESLMSKKVLVNISGDNFLDLLKKHYGLISAHFLADQKVKIEIKITGIKKEST